MDNTFSALIKTTNKIVMEKFKPWDNSKLSHGSSIRINILFPFGQIYPNLTENQKVRKFDVHKWNQFIARFFGRVFLHMIRYFTLPMRDGDD